MDFPLFSFLSLFLSLFEMKAQSQPFLQQSKTHILRNHFSLLRKLRIFSSNMWCIGFNVILITISAFQILFGKDCHPCGMCARELLSVWNKIDLEKRFCCCRASLNFLYGTFCHFNVISCAFFYWLHLMTRVSWKENSTCACHMRSAQIFMCSHKKIVASINIGNVIK